MLFGPLPDLACEPYHHISVIMIMRYKSPFQRLRLPTFMVFFSLCLCCSGEEKGLIASRSYLRDLKEMFMSMEIAEVNTPPAEMVVDELKLPSFRLRNKGSIPVSAPRYPSANVSSYNQPGPLGVPVWKFSPLAAQDPKSSSAIFIKGRNVVPAAPFEPGSSLEVGPGDPSVSFAKDAKLTPGKYRLSVEFRPYYPISFVYPQGSLPALTLGSPKTFIITIMTSEQEQDAHVVIRKPYSSTLTKKAGAGGRDETLLRNDKTNLGKSALMDAIVLEKVEVGLQVLKAGAPLSFSFTLAVRPGFSLREPEASKPSALKYTWGVSKVIASGKREHVHSYQYVIDPRSFRQLCETGSCTASNFLPDEIKLEPGAYELDVCFWDDAITLVRGGRNAKYVLFKVVK